MEVDDNATMRADKAVSISAGERGTTPIVHHAHETTEETDVDNEAGNLTPGPQMGVSQPLRTAASGHRQRHRTHDAAKSAILKLRSPVGSWDHRIERKNRRTIPGDRDPARV
ncbi:hypothetical protein NDU88_003244 [Pleurodeles waltl]|uniref:Uncharacterized protein n=1 Tax=Pleurodeles waltl TaxID=8319 RepID=A0AAV7WS98_PLEWA|nr:hypothetical protein NDU88_003244 [Pleurodeles waltl]